MKKAISILLSVLMIFSCFAVAGYAEGEEMVNVTFIYKYLDENGKVQEATVQKETEKGKVIMSNVLDDWLSDMPHEFVETYIKNETGYSQEETRTYVFAGFSVKDYEDQNYRYNWDSNATIDEDTVFIAEYKITDTGEYTTLLELIGSIFARINLIFEYFFKIFGWGKN